MAPNRTRAAKSRGQETLDPQEQAGAPDQGAQQTLGNSQVQQLLLGGGDDSGFKGNLDAFRARMEGAFGQSFSSVQLVGGQAGQAGLSPGAVATARGRSIWVGEAFGAMGAGEQEEVLAHELAHVVQAGGGGGAGDADPDQDANQAAAQALAGRPAATGAAVAPGDAHDWSFREAIDNVGDAAMDLAMRQIESAAELIAFVGRFGEAAAKKAIDFLVAHKVEIVVGLLTLNPGNALLVYAIRKLPTDRLTAFLQSAEAATAAKIVGIAIAAGAIAVVAAALFAAGPAVLPILKELAGPTIALLWQHAPEEMKRYAQQMLVEGWPVGLGLELEGSIGATFGYPVYLGVEAFFSVSHASSGVFELRRGGIMTEAFDTGVGAGGFVGIGGGKKGDGEGEGAIGIGAEAGAQFQAGLKQFVLQEFSFPVTEDTAFASFLIAVMQADTSASMSILSLFSSQLRAVNPISYNTMTKIELKEFAEGNAAAQAGVRTGGADTRSGGGTWNNQEGTRDNGATKWWQRWMRAGIFGRLAGEVVQGFEQRNKEFTTDAEGVRVPSVMEIDLYGEGSVAASIVHAIPVISQALPQVPSFDGGAGIRVTWTLRGSPTDAEPQVSEPLWQLYTKTGNMDRYNGAASETSIAVGNLSAETFASVDSFLASIQAGSTFKRRFSIGSQLGRRYFLMAQRQGAFNVMLPADYRAYGFRIEGYLDLESSLTADMVRSVFRSIIDTVAGYRDGGAPLQQLYTDVMTFLSTGRGPAHVTSKLRGMADTILAGVKKLKLHGLVGLSVAAGAKVSAGAKLRLQGRVGGQITMDHDLLADVGGAITVADIEALIQGGVDAVTGALEVEGDASASGSGSGG
jgi:hypothetical protein